MSLMMRMMWCGGFVLLMTVAVCAEPPAEKVAPEKPAADKEIVWEFDRLDRIGGHAPQVLGEPRLVEDGARKAVAFDGKQDGLIIPNLPIAGWKTFTAEVVFQPARAGEKEQRFFHLQEEGTENRLLFETRLTADDKWFLDTFIQSGTASATLFAEKELHPIGPWYHAAVVVDAGEMRHYVNGKLELSSKLEFTPLKAGGTSAGVRFNRVFWYKGSIQKARFTPRALAPKEFWKAE